MKLVTYATSTPLGSGDRLGAIAGDAIVDLAAANEALTRGEGGGAASAALALVPASLLGLLQHEAAGMDRARRALDFAVRTGGFSIPLEGARLRAPLPRPNSIRDFMLVEEHMRNSGMKVPPEWFEIPAYYKGNPDAVFGPGDDIRWPAYSAKLDFELEIAAVIGRRVRQVSVDQAAACIAGYTIFNDWSARDIQFREMRIRLGPAYGKDFANSIGPCLVTTDELPDPRSIRLEARVNGEIWTTGTLGAMQFGFSEVVSYLSQEQTLMPGDLLGSGTIARGCGLELDRWLAAGDLVELEAAGIGVLANRVVASSP